MTESTDLRTAFLAGGAAGLAVDVSLFPLDTVKTRLQSEQGFWRAGGVRGVYAGIASTTIGSVPTAALFFCTYELTKGFLQKTQFGERYAPLTHMLGASLGEVTACLVRVPVEVVKQRAQTTSRASSYSVFRSTIRQEGFSGLFRGYFSTVLRDFPFSFLQFPIWEYLKSFWSRKQGRPVDPWQSAVCGAGAGGSAALITNPLDVAKTRIMLAKKGTELAKDSITFALKTVYRDRGITGLFAGAVPRTTMVSVGGAIFLGVYDKAKVALESIWT